MLDAATMARVQKALNVNETLLWAGKPCVARAWTKATKFFMLVGIAASILGAVIIAVIASTFLLQGDSSARVFGLVTLVIFSLNILLTVGTMALAPFWRKKWAASLVYVITTKRALRLGWPRSTSWSKARWFTPDRIDRQDGTSALIFTKSDWQQNGRVLTTGFEDLSTADAMAAENVISDLLAEGSSAE